jgi:hypothetical protein
MNASENLIKWLAGGERGISSNTIVEHLTGIPATRGWKSHPLDPDDLGRCRKLLDQCQELVPRFWGVRELSPQWMALVDRWYDLCAMMDDEAPDWRSGTGRCPKTYALMKDLTLPSDHQDAPG